MAVEITGDTSPLAAALQRAKAMLGAFPKMLGGIGTLAIGAGLAAGFEKIRETIKDAADYAGDMKKLAVMMGTSTEEASKLAYAFKTVGVEVDDLQKLAVHLQRSIVEAADGGDSVFKKLGIDARSLLGKPFEQQMQAVSEAIMSIHDPAIQMTVAMDVFGKQGYQAAAMFRKGLAEAKEEAVELGFVVTSDMADKAKSYKKTLKVLGEVFESSFLQIGLALLPAKDSMKRFLGNVIETAKSIREFVADNKGLLMILGSIGTATFAASVALTTFQKTWMGIAGVAGVGLLPLKLGFAVLAPVIGTAVSMIVGAVGLIPTAIGLIPTAIGMAGSAFMWLAGVVPMIFTPLGAVVAISAALGVTWLSLSQTGQSFTATLGERFSQLGTIVSSVVRGIRASFVDIVRNTLPILKDGFFEVFETLSTGWKSASKAFGEGDLKKAGQILFKTVEIAGTEAWETLKDAASDAWNRIKVDAKEAFAQVRQFLADIRNDIQPILDAVNKVIESL
ncbi:MAG: hypothetical protein KGR26_10705, partial [Cyanobacteria bacterium REEB65]|nr:hypothetical protein [Cyanobacteria bacterium REEB65]